MSRYRELVAFVGVNADGVTQCLDPPVIGRHLTEGELDGCFMHAIGDPETN